MTLNPLMLRASDETQVTNIMKLFKQGWEQKDTTLISKCFHNMSPDQKKLYDILFSQIDKITVTFDIKQVNVQKTFCNVNTLLTKNIIFKNSNGQTVTQSENINYILLNANNQWGIIGTVYPDRKQETVRVTDKNLPMINKKLAQIGAEHQKDVFKDYITVSEKYNKIYYERPGSAVSFRIEMNTFQDRTNNKNTRIWTLEKNYLSYAEIPKIVLDKMQKDTTYYLDIASFDKDSSQITRQILKIRIGNQGN